MAQQGLDVEAGPSCSSMAIECMYLFLHVLEPPEGIGMTLGVVGAPQELHECMCHGLGNRTALFLCTWGLCRQPLPSAS